MSHGGSHRLIEISNSEFGRCWNKFWALAPLASSLTHFVEDVEDLGVHWGCATIEICNMDSKRRQSNHETINVKCEIGIPDTPVNKLQALL